MSGETDLARMLATLEVDVRPQAFVLLTRPQPDASLDAIADARIREAEGLTYVVTAADARDAGDTPDFTAAWLTLRVHSSLDAVGLTAAVATALAQRGIACNVLAGHFHDHLLVPVARLDDALDALAALRDA